MSNERNKELNCQTVIASIVNRRLRTDYRKDHLKEIPQVTPRVVRVVIEEYLRIGKVTHGTQE